MVEQERHSDSLGAMVATPEMQSRGHVGRDFWGVFEKFVIRVDEVTRFGLQSVYHAERLKIIDRIRQQNISVLLCDDMRVALSAAMAEVPCASCSELMVGMRKFCDDPQVQRLESKKQAATTALSIAAICRGYLPTDLTCSLLNVQLLLGDGMDL